MTALVEKKTVKGHIFLGLSFLTSLIFHWMQFIDKLSLFANNFIFPEEFDSIAFAIGEKVFVKEEVLHILI